ncbi:hypothetical protein HK101_000884 [Irineochytrium annulatum]|nr:hypothetical protein HK101_000884 [Irineochytrium annulatum]
MPKPKQAFSLRSPNKNFIRQVVDPLIGDPIHHALSCPAPHSTAPLIATRIHPTSPLTNFTVANLLSPSECEALITHLTRLGVEPALLNVGRGLQVMDTNVRKGSRRIVDSPELARRIWERLAPLVQTAFELGGGEKMELLGLNERLRFLYYAPGDRFAEHRDGHYQTPDGSARSRLTLQIYLNSGMVGGRTTMAFETYDGLDRGYAVVPDVGLGTVFDHRITHAGEEVQEGEKWCMRTDIMFAMKK